MLNETPMLFPMAPAEFWKQIRSTIDEVVKENISQPLQPLTTDHLPEKALLKASNVCAVFQVSKPTLYEWLQQGKLKSFKIKSRRYLMGYVPFSFCRRISGLVTNVTDITGNFFHLHKSISSNICKQFANKLTVKPSFEGICKV